VRSALELFSMRGYETVGVAELAERAGVTTGSLYHHFGGKLELHELVRSDVERRVADRVAAVLESGPSSLGVALLGAYDWLLRVGYSRLLSAPAQADSSELVRVLSDAVGGPTTVITLAAWRAALAAVAENPESANEYRGALAALLEA
jgi:AcrR family transcriptional regulator